MAAHREPTFKGHAHGDLSITEDLADNTIILPLYHDMTEADVVVIVGAISSAADVG